MYEGIENNLFWNLLLLNVAAYFVCSFIAIVVNFIADYFIVNRKLINSRFLGMFGVLTVSFVFVLVSVNGLDTQNLPPYQRGLLLGDAISRASTPGIIVLACVGVFSWLERKNNAKKTPNE
jgi:hypothetical protein